MSADATHLDTASLFVPIDGDRLTVALAGSPIGHIIDRYDTLTSTMAKAHAASPTTPSGWGVLAEEQTLGRGRLDRRWQAPFGTSLLLSILLREEPLPQQPGRLPMIAGLALLDAVAHVAPGLSCGLKWPNDLLVGDDPRTARKAAGILVEGVLVDGRATSAIVGIGINVNQRRDQLPAVAPPARTPTSLAIESGTLVDRTALLIALCRAFAFHLFEPDASVMARWRSNLWTLGRPVRAHHPDGSVTEGLAVDVGPTGALLIETADGDRLPVDAGDVSLTGG